MSVAQPFQGTSLYRPSPADLQAVDAASAMRTLRELLLGEPYKWVALLRGGGGSVRHIEVSEEGFQIKTDRDYKGPKSFLFVDMTNIEVWEQPYLFHKEQHVRIAGDAFLRCDADEQEVVERCSRRLADVLFVLAREARGEGSDEKFNAVVAAYRSADPKPSFPEEARRFRVQAEFAVEQKRFEDAARFYRDALKAAPWWPEGYYNRSLVLAELKRYPEAVREMKRFLALEPSHPRARAAQDQIYRWESVSK
jgi:tetratricopeptide (TPR) repeat protein